MKEPETSTAEPHAVVARGDRLQEAQEDPAAAQANADDRAAQCDVAKVCELYDAFQSLNRECDEIRELRNANAKSMKGKLEPETRAALIAEGKELKDKLAALEGTLGDLEFQLQTEGQKVPNDTHPEVPVGGEELAALRKEVGAKRDFSFEAASHVDLGERLGMFDFETGGKVCGSRFVYLTGAGAMLELALISWAMAKVGPRGSSPWWFPISCGRPPWRSAGSSPARRTRRCTTSKTAICAWRARRRFSSGVCTWTRWCGEGLPIKMAAFSHCFRTERAPPAPPPRHVPPAPVQQGGDVHHLTPEQSDAIHDELIAIEEEMYTELGFHFKVLDMSSQDLGAPAYRKFDIEAWMPALGRYGEISSASNCTDYQARRLNIKYRPDPVDGKKQPLQHCHTLNATACAVPRMIITILENFQNEDGSVTVPEPLRPFMGGVEILTPEVVGA